MNNFGELDKTLKLLSDLFETLFKISDQKFVKMTNNAGKASTWILHKYNQLNYRNIYRAKTRFNNCHNCFDEYIYSFYILSLYVNLYLLMSMTGKIITACIVSTARLYKKRTEINTISPISLGSQLMLKGMKSGDTCFRPAGFLAPEDFKLFGFPVFWRTCWCLFQNRVVCTDLDIHVFISSDVN